MKVTIEVPKWMAQELAANTKSEFDQKLVELALRSYLMNLRYPVLLPQKLSERAMVAMYGDG